VKIVAHMSEMPYLSHVANRESPIEYRYGEFFPTELSPFGYNETVAQEYFPLGKSEVEAKGFKWREPDVRAYTITKKPDELPERITEVSDSITNEVIGCAHEGKCADGCATAFRVVPQELQFYRRLHLPLPKLCPNCRHYARLAKRNPPKLWKRRCGCNGATSEQRQGTGEYKNSVAHFHGNALCPNEFETSYTPERKELIYCEACYQAEVA
jgi:hypothetical protein